MHNNRRHNDGIKARFTAVVVLGAGFGSRFGGEDKLGALLAGKAVAHHVLSTLQPFGWARKILVYRRHAEWIGAFQDDKFVAVHNDAAEQGMLSSLRKGVQAVQDVAQVLVCLADMPFVGADHITRLLSAAEGMEGRIVASRGDAYCGPPAIFPAGELKKLPSSGEGGGRSLLASASFVDCANGKLLDVDTLCDLATAETRLLAHWPP
ncbi:MobA-related protein (modular protein) [Agrobacterium deltaense Zutra 3/1]|uniref:MobA-related protein (Modular protein) n=2 Tax=Agrobacterium deltaense TaxID=1183412 RepID=A0A1S7S2G9_9HYPH|nr:MobA-related protein (modular protein) [Agrobacterium deltaense Zutra 3/1]